VDLIVLQQLPHSSAHNVIEVLIAQQRNLNRATAVARCSYACVDSSLFYFLFAGRGLQSNKRVPAAEWPLFGLRFGIDVRLLVQRGAETRLIAGNESSEGRRLEESSGGRRLEESSGGSSIGSKGACACRCCAEVLNEVAPQAVPRVAYL